MALDKPCKMKPLPFFMSMPADGHTNPLLAIATSMVQRGYDVAYICSADYRDRIIEAGAELCPGGLAVSLPRRS